MSDFPSFEELVKLAEEDPQKLERFRLEQVEHLINKSPSKIQRRLRGLQFQIDAQRRLHSHSPMGSCIKLSQMMNESFTELRIWLNKVSNTSDPILGNLEKLDIQEQKVAEIVPFPK